MAGTPDTVVVVTNGSEDGAAAVRRAGEVALERDAIVHLLAIVDEVAHWHRLRTREGLTVDPAVQAEIVLQQAAHELYDLGVFVQRHVSRVPVGRAIVEAVMSTGASAVVLPPQTALALDGLACPCPVHVVGEHDASPGVT